MTRREQLEAVAPAQRHHAWYAEHGALLAQSEAWTSWQRDATAWCDLIDAGAVAPEDEPEALEACGVLVARARRWRPEEAAPMGVVISITPGPGGREAEDWRGLLTRMYIRWAQSFDWDVDLMDDGADGSAVVLALHTPAAAAVFFPERGVHRLVRVSPHDRNNRVHSSFAHVAVAAQEEVSDDNPPISRKDVVITTMKSSGPGGQHVNKTESAVRMEHRPSGIRVVVRQGRSQHENKRAAWNLLSERVAAWEAEQRGDGDPDRTDSSGGERGWGRQIRTYHIPDNRVVDHTTGEKMGAARAVLDGRVPESVLQRHQAHDPISPQNGQHPQNLGTPPRP